MNYVERFLNLKCAGDVLNVVQPINKPCKEISESMAAIRYIKKIVLAEPDTYYLYDLCAGNALTSVLAAFLLPIKGAIAIDREIRNRPWHNVQGFCYRGDDIYKFEPENRFGNSILIGVHACTNLSERITDMYLQSNAKHLVLVPCCMGPHDLPQLVSKKMGKYLAWCLHLAQKVGGTVYEDKGILSPMNGVVVAHKPDIERRK